MRSKEMQNIIRKYYLFSFHNVIFLAALANLFRNNIFLAINKPFYYLRKVHNIEFIYFIISIFSILVLRCESYLNSLNFRIYFIIDLLSKIIFFSTFKINFSLGFGLTLSYHKNFLLFMIVILVSSLCDFLDYKISCKTITKHKPEGIIISFCKNFTTLFKKTKKEMFSPLLVSFSLYLVFYRIYYISISNKPSYIALFMHLFSSFFFVSLTFFFYTLIAKFINFCFEYDTSNMDIHSLNNVDFNNLPVNSFYFNKISSGFNVKETKLQILKTKSIINYLKGCLFLEIEEIKSTITKIDDLFDSLERVKYIFIPVLTMDAGLDPKGLYRKVPTGNHIQIILNKIKTYFAFKCMKYELRSHLASLTDKYDFIKEAVKVDLLYNLLADAKYEIDKELRNIKYECIRLEEKTENLICKEIGWLMDM